MPARVHAILVTRTSSTSLARLLRVIDALRQQTLAPDALTIVVCGHSEGVRESPAVAAAAEGIIETRANTSFAAAAVLAYPRVQEGSSIWLLTHDSVPEPHALANLVGALERSPSAAVAAPKLISENDTGAIVSFGQTMTSYGRAVDPARGELDQGQHDARDDALGADVRGMLIRAERRDALRPDAGLGGEDEGLDIGVRARLSGGRVALTAAARVRVPDDTVSRTGTAGYAFATRRAQLHRRLSYAPAVAVPFHWLSLLPLALWRSITHLVGKRPAAVAPEWAAAFLAMLNPGAVTYARRMIRTDRKTSWSRIAPLRVSHRELRQRLDDGHGSEGGSVQELGFFSGGGAWAVLAALVVSVVSFTALLAWPALGGGALLPLRETVGALWRDATYGARHIGVDLVGPADPFAGIVALLGSFWPGAPSFALVLLWLAALPLAVLGGWFAATRFTDRAALRIFAGVVWALAPTFLVALTQGRPAAVIVHLALPWLFHAALVAHRSWGAAGAASLLALIVVASAPSLAPALVTLWLVGIVVALVRRSVRGAVRVLWVLIPTAIIFTPLVIWQLSYGNAWAIFADPGFIVALPQAGADIAGRLALVAGFPVTDATGWAALLGVDSAAWALWLTAPLGVLALISTVSPRWSAGIFSLLVAALGVVTAFVAVGFEVSFADSMAVAIWPGTALSLAWMGVLGAALVTLESAFTLPALRATAALIAAAALAVCAVPPLTAVIRDASELTNGPVSTLPAYVNAQARDDRDFATLVLTPQPVGGVALEVVWGASNTLGSQSTMLSTATRPHGRDISTLAVDLISSRKFDGPAELSAVGIRYVLLEQARGEESDTARAQRLEAVTALDQRAGFVRVGETSKGVLWRLEAEPQPRPNPSTAVQASTQFISIVSLLVVLAALLLAVPTRASRRAARAKPRVVGLPAVLAEPGDEGVAAASVAETEPSVTEAEPSVTEAEPSVTEAESPVTEIESPATASESPVTEADDVAQKDSESKNETTEGEL